MQRRPKVRLGLSLAAGLAILMAFSLLMAYLASLFDSPEQVCKKQCAKFNKLGELVYHGPATPKDTSRLSDCVCR